MTVFLTAQALWLAGALASLLLGRGRAAHLLGAATAVAGCLLCLAFALTVLALGQEVTYAAAWPLPLGHLSLGVDALSALFLLPLSILGAACAVSGASALAGQAGERRLGGHWFFFNLVLAATALVPAARDGVVFLVAWEIMSVSPFFLIAWKDTRSRVRHAAWLYLVAAHLGAACVIGLMASLGGVAGSFDFAAMAQAGVSGGWPFLLALVGFGAKAGLVPAHVWLPEAHPAAPSHISAFLSGALIKAGVYGFLRVLPWIGPLADWQAGLLTVIGLLTGLLGILFALAQTDIKRLLAYSSVENIGIIFLGLGLGSLGLVNTSEILAVLGFGGALLHVLHHGLMKGLLFLAAGNVLHATGSTDINDLGGLAKRMPRTGLAFAVGAAAICGLPPLAGFTGELLLFLGAAADASTLPLTTAVTVWAAVAGLAFIGGMALLAMTKALGLAFSGEPRSRKAAKAHEVPAGEALPPLVLAGLCLLAAVAVPWTFRALQPALAPLLASLTDPAPGIDLAQAALTWTAVAAAGLGLLLALLAGLRRWLLRGRPVREAVTWDCGYAAPAPRMQYSATSYSLPLAGLLQRILRPATDEVLPEGFFPRSAMRESVTPDWLLESWFDRLFGAVARLFDLLKELQHGKTHIYILYMVVTLMAVLVWRFSTW